MYLEILTDVDIKMQFQTLKFANAFEFKFKSI